MRVELEELRALAEHDVKFSMVTAPYPASTVLSLLDRIEELEGALRGILYCDGSWGGTVAWWEAVEAAIHALTPPEEET